MRRAGSNICALVVLLVVLPCAFSRAAPVISEFVARNQSGLQDEDGDYSDWIEIHNPDEAAVDLGGWHLSDDAEDLEKWEFPSVVLPAGGYLVVFASDKDRAAAGSELHTNFRLAGEGEFLALVAPDGVTAASRFAPYPPQIADVAYGTGVSVQSEALLASGDPILVHVPDAASGPALGLDWTGRTYNEGSRGESWTAARSGVGFDAGGAMTPLIGAGGNLQGAMLNVAPGAFLRSVFAVSDLPAVVSLTLRLKHDDGFVAYLNGEEVARHNVPSAAGAYREAVLADGPLLYWPFDEEDDTANAKSLVNDLPANELVARGAATRVGSTLTAGGLPLGRAASFDATAGTRFDAADLAPDTPLTAFAVEFWFRIDGTPNRYFSEAFGESGSANRPGMIYNYNPGELEIFSGGRTGAVVSANEWHHVVAAHYGGGGGAEIHLDGAAAATVDRNGGYGQPQEFGRFAIGNTVQANAAVNGEIDEYAIYDLSGLPDLAARRAHVAKIASHHGLAGGPALAWDSVAASDRPDAAALSFQSFDLTPRLDLLQAGTNVLAIHGLNDSVASPNFLVLPELEAARTTGTTAAAGYLTVPTPGLANRPAESELGPVVTAVSASPAVPATGEEVVVTAAVREAFAPVASVGLVYRVAFAAEVSVEMRDDGGGRDAAAGDGVFTAVIPAGAAGTRQMLRWKVVATDTPGRVTSDPRFADPDGSPEYHGTVVAPALDASPLPVLHWFVENPAAAETGSGTRASLHFNGEFYDNVFVRIRGATARNWPKKSYKFDFNRGHHFRFDPDHGRVEEININTTYTDKSYVRTFLASDAFHAVGQPASLSFPVRVEQNRSFYSVAQFVEQVDADFLRRNGLDEDGALYKANLNTLGGGDELGQGTDGMDKKTRLHEDESDMQTLIDRVRLTGPALDRYLFDHIDLPSVVNFMATSVVIQDIDRWATNFYMYRDSDGTGEWRFLPWDVDLTFGPDRLNTNTIVASQDTGNNASHPLLGGSAYPYSRPTLWNGLLDAVFRDPRTLDMYLRRLRTVADQLLATGYFEDRIGHWWTQLSVDVPLDRARWGGSAHFGGTTLSMQQEGNRIKSEYLAPRRTHLFVTHAAPNGVGIPASQPSAPRIEFGAVEPNPATGNQDEEFVELVNPNGFAVDVSGWQVRGGIDLTLAPGTVILPGESLFLSPDVAAFRARLASPTGGEGRFVQGNYAGHLSNFGEALTLTDAEGTLIDEIVTPVDPSDAQRYLVVSELHYHPAGDPGAEFIELLNISESVALDLDGVRFTAGVSFDFTGSAVTSLAPGARALVVRDEAAFVAAHGLGLPVAGAFAGGTVLDNDGETLKLEDASNSTIREFIYNDKLPWPESADGLGASLVLIRPASAPDHDDPANWRPSAAAGGSPGTSDATAFAGDPNADADSNGLPDLIDYLLGNDLGLGEAVPEVALGPVEVDGVTETYATISYRLSVAADDAVETVAVSDDLQSWIVGPESVELVSATHHGDGTATMTWRSAMPVDGRPRLFFRLEVTLR